MRGRYGWILVLLAVGSWDLAAALTNGETLTYTFRRAVTQTAWRWPVLVVIVLLVTHLFLPEHLTKYDPLDRLYQKLDTVEQPKPHPTGPTPTTPGGGGSGPTTGGQPRSAPSGQPTTEV